MSTTAVRLGWNPYIGDGFAAMTGYFTQSDAWLLDADEEEIQVIGTVCWADGGSHTFGTSGSKIGWLAGASISFGVVAVLTIGIKKSSTIDASNGPPGRATIGAAAFDVSVGLVGGVDTISSTTWRDDAMTAGTPFTLAHGDMAAVCFHLDVTSGTQSIKVRAAATGATFNLPAATLVTSGPTYTAQTNFPNFIITADDGTLGWIESSIVNSAVGSEAIGNTNLYGNIIQVDAPVTIDAVRGMFTVSGTTAFDFGIWSDPLGTPAAVSGANVSVNPRNLSGATLRFLTVVLPTPLALTAGTNYALAVKQNSASSLTVQWSDVNATGEWVANGIGPEVYAAKSTAGGAFAAQNSSKRRAAFWFRVSAIDSGVAGNANILRGSVVA